ncbi:MAG: GDP-mannose mannosyl hydrolase [Gammaproteobacteria bacterium]
MLNQEDFLAVVEHTPLVSIDLVISSPEKAILMGKRLNEPAAGFWFVPGGRILKLETLEKAFNRISEIELGQAYNIKEANLLGAFTHLYDNNFAGVHGIGTHYVVLAYQLHATLTLEKLPRQQHDGYRWFSENADLKEVHPNSRAYFPYLR